MSRVDLTDCTTMTDPFHILSRFQLKLYTPEAHNEMVSALTENGVDGDLDEIVQAFANVQPSVAALILKQAKAIRND